jgi:ketosteroid isomerase-like protein
MEASVRAFFVAMNAQDADAAAALAREDVTISLGPHEMVGHDALRDLAQQTDDALSFEMTPLEIDVESANVIIVRALRVQRWRETGAVAVEEELRARFTFDPGGTITQIELAPAGST